MQEDKTMTDHKIPASLVGKARQDNMISYYTLLLMLLTGCTFLWLT